VDSSILAKKLKEGFGSLTSPENVPEPRTGGGPLNKIFGKLLPQPTPENPNPYATMSQDKLQELLDKAGALPFKKFKSAQSAIEKELQARRDKEQAEATEELRKFRRLDENDVKTMGLRKGGKVKAKAKPVKRRGDGCCVKGKTKGRMV
jgi:hypothetical protein